MSRKAKEYNAINLAQGFPDFDGPDWLIDLLKENVIEKNNQYSPSEGALFLRESISHLFEKSYGLKYCPKDEITVMNGATEAIYCTIKALINPGDEVVLFEPFYDSYLGSIRMAHGTPIPVTLEAPHFSITNEDLEKAINKNTKLIILNNPHNPSGKVFTREELALIADIASKYDCYILSDEVYEHLVYDDQLHIPIATFNNMKKRTITISSSGKTFGVTGWKVGWAMSSPHIIKAIRNIHQFTTFCAHHPTQIAIAQAMQRFDDYRPLFQKNYQQKRDFIYSKLQSIGFNPIHPKGSYFTLVPIPKKFSDLDDFSFCEFIIENYGVALIPPSSFYLKSNQGKKFFRLCFAKKQDTLEKAILSLQEVGD